MTSCYHGPRSWACAWEQRLRSRIGTITPDGRLITAVQARNYGTSWTRYGVVERWEYFGRPDLGEYGADKYLLLPP
jgi:hypothetical protein